MTTAVIGAGVMGETLIAGIIASGVPASDVVIAERRTERANELTNKYGVVCTDPVTAVVDADTVLLVVKPQDMSDAISEISLALNPDAVIISLAAGISTAVIESKLQAGQPVVRVMPNTPALVNEGMAGISAGSSCNQEHVQRAIQLMSSVGEVVEVPENLQDALTAVSGSGPAYVFYVIESMVAAGVDLGLDRDVATQLAIQTVYGAAALIKETGEEAQTLRERVSSPNGTTVAAINTLDSHHVREAFKAAMTACRDRSIELGKENKK
jgi:pyrroline-5-carboxylate reductase